MQAEEKLKYFAYCIAIHNLQFTIYNLQFTYDIHKAVFLPVEEEGIDAGSLRA